MIKLDVMSTLADAVIEYRKKENLSQNDLADMLYCDVDDINRIEHGLRPLSCAWFFVLCDILNN